MQGLGLAANKQQPESLGFCEASVKEKLSPVAKCETRG